MYTINRLVACKPFEVTSNRTEISKGLALIEQKIKLSKTEVLYVYTSDNLALFPKDLVYIRGEHVRMAWAKEVFLNENNDKFILVPVDCIISIEPSNT